MVYKMDMLDLIVIVEILVPFCPIQQKLVRLSEILSMDVALMHQADAPHKFAEVTPVLVWQYAVQECRTQAL